MAELMAAEVGELAGPKGRHDPARVATRHGTEPGTVTLGGRRLAIQRPRVRTVGADAHEVALASYQAFTDTDLMADGIVARMLAGLSTRRYPAGWSRSASRPSSRPRAPPSRRSPAGSWPRPPNARPSCWPAA
jgi:putative transposase